MHSFLHHVAVVLGSVACWIVPTITCLASTSVSKTGNRGIRALRQVSHSPLIFTIDNYVDEGLCAVLGGSEAGGSNSESLLADARLKFASLIAAELFAGQWGPNDGLRFNLASSSDANNNDESSSTHCPEGLHVDTNNDSTFRSVTAILYLNDVHLDCCGATVFPLANADDNDPVMGAALRLFGDQIAHTRGPRAASSNGLSLSLDRQADAAFLEERVGVADAPGLRIQPQAGRLCIFFSRLDSGEIDPRSWHGGERLLSQRKAELVGNPSDFGGEIVIEKRILTLFKEVCYAGNKARPDSYDTTFESYLAPQIKEQRRFLKALAESHAQFFEDE